MMIILLINILILLFVPFLMIGVIKKTKAFWAGRKGVSVWQPVWDFLRLIKKDSVISETTSWVFKFAPIAGFASVVFAAMFVPLAFGKSVINIPFAFVIFSYILGFGKFFSLISALDTGSSFEGMGASREACFSTIVEPAFFIGMASIAALSQNYTFDSFKLILQNAGGYGYLIIALAVITLFIMLLIEGCRVPVDDPTTHLELTMIHEVMILDNSGADLALLTWANGIKMVILMSLIANLIIPLGYGLLTSAGLFLLIMLILAVILGTLESAIARLRMSHVFEFVFVMSSFALIVASLAAVKMYGI